MEEKNKDQYYLGAFLLSQQSHMKVPSDTFPIVVVSEQILTRLR